jgi:allantoate deiminase
MDTRFASMLERSVEQCGFPIHVMPSGAGHDAMILASRMPAAMLFVRSPGGVSHHPAESVTEADVAPALNAALHFLDALAASPHERSS